MKFSCFCLSLAFLCCAASLPAQTVRVHGASTMEKLIALHKGEIESQAGLKLELIGNASPRGLADLQAAQTDIAMVAGSLKGVAEAVNATKPGSVSTEGMVETMMSSSKVVFVVHSAVGIKSLTAAQAFDLFSGKVTNWKELGGADLPVKVVLPGAGEGTWVMVREQIMNGTDFAKGAIVRNSSKEIPPVIRQLPGSVAFLSEENAVGLSPVTCDKDIRLPLMLVTKGEPTGDNKKVIDAIKAVVK